MVQQISDSEMELMHIIWAKGGSILYAELAEELSQMGKTWQKNTIITLLARLVDKELLTTNKIGRRNRYTALISEMEYQSNQTDHFLQKLYGGDAKGLVSMLIQREKITPKDYEELKEFWEKRKWD